MKLFKRFKRCCGCGDWKTVSSFYVHNRPNRNPYLYSRCKSCWSEINRRNNKKWRLANSEHVSDYNAQYRASNLDYFKAWYENNKSRYRIYRAKRREQGSEAYTEEDIEYLYKQQDGLCVYCGVPLDRFEVDHMLALSRGGTSDRENLCLACRSCNRRKHTKTPDEFKEVRI